MKQNFLPIFLLVVLLTSCNHSKIYEKRHKTDNLSWNRFRVMEYNVEVDDISVGYDILIAIRHVTDIPFKMLEVGSTMVSPSGETRFLEHRIRIKDKEGKLLGDGMGNLWDLVVPLRTNFMFDREGVTKIELSNLMVRLETIGIMEVGLIVKKSD